MADAESRRWRLLIETASALIPCPLQAVEFRAITRHGKTRPVVLLCTDGTYEKEYVVKGRGEIIHAKGHIHPKTLFNDHVVGRLGVAMGAPVADVELIEIPDVLIQMNWSMAHLLGGIAHGSRLIPMTTDAETVLHCGLPENGTRFSLLAILFGWIHVEEDLQFIYDRTPPQLVHSVDHGDCFPNGPNWRVSDLAATKTVAPLDAITTACGLGETALRQAAEALRTIEDGTIAAALSAPPAEWLVPLDERVALAMYLSRRRDQLLALLLPDK
ncbi:MAG: hypothetical protein QOJ59_1901 [Thermomicrobiales bacterium]|nr:hypothetical protein [Thermomicrobiales bacterium]